MSDIFGVDVSHYQQNIDWAKVKATGRTFAILKAQYENGNHGYDPTFLYNYKNAKLNGFIVDVYDYFGSATLSDPAGQASSLVGKLKPLNFNGTIWMDHENAKLKGIGKTATNLMIQKYAAVITAAGYKLGIYCNYDWYKNVLDVENLKKLYSFWIARYHFADAGIYNAASVLSPKAFAHGWQYSSKGHINGIIGNVDLDVMYNVTIIPAQTPTSNTKPSSMPKYEVGKTYVLQKSMYVRTEPNGANVLYSQLSVNAKANGKAADKGIAVLNAGTKVTCKAVKVTGSGTWIRIPSGWICGISSTGKVYVK